MARPCARFVWVGALLTLCAGCGSSNSNSSSGNGTTEAVAPDPNELRFDTPSYHLEPGQETRYFCYTTHISPDHDTAITQVHPIYGQATHHLGVYQTRSPETEGQYDCPELIKDTWIPLYGGGVQSGTLTVPEGGGFQVKAGTQVLVQLHLLNATTSPIDDKATIVMKTSDDPNITPAGVFGFDNRTIDIPANSMDVEQTQSCTAGRDMDVFGVFGHMHKYGTHLELSRGATIGAEVLYQAPWTFDDQPNAAANFHVNASDTLNTRCTYSNTSNAPLEYGESTYDEMCTFLLYYTPYTGLAGCLKTPM